MMQHLTPKTTCSSCRLRDLCMPLGLSSSQMAQIDQMVSTRVKVRRGNLLFHAGEHFKSLYAIRTGFFKTTVGTPDGLEQVSGFYMAGELLGLDGIVQEQYTCSARALEDSDICVLHMQELNALAQVVQPLQHHVQKIMSREIVQDHEHLFLMGAMRSEARVASFLLNLLARLHARGQASDELLLRMTREDIGSYLGLTLETVSRAFSKLARDGLIELDQRRVRILQSEALHLIAHHIDASACVAHKAYNYNFAAQTA
jgi:CRP/FNR family transcriptional regulator, anaerobic regulatory protein